MFITYSESNVPLIVFNRDVMRIINTKEKKFIKIESINNEIHFILNDTEGLSLVRKVKEIHNKCQYSLLSKRNINISRKNKDKVNGILREGRLEVVFNEDRFIYKAS